MTTRTGRDSIDFPEIVCGLHGKKMLETMIRKIEIHAPEKLKGCIEYISSFEIVPSGNGIIINGEWWAYGRRTYDKPPR